MVAPLALIGVGSLSVGLVAVAFLVGFLARNGWDRTLRSSIGAMFLSEAVQYTVAIPWLAGLSVQKALVLGLYPSVLGMHSSSRGRRLAPSRLAPPAAT